MDEKLKRILEERKDKIHLALPTSCGNIPVMVTRGKSLAEAWENSMIGLYVYGREARTKYDKKDEKGNFIEPPSKDCTMVMIVEEPSSEPFIHKAFPGGIEDLEEYRQEVFGAKDHWIRDWNDPNDTRWEYTYHQRICSYNLPGTDKTYNQLEQVINGLAESPYNRRLQVTTWQPWLDPYIEHGPCLQRLWFRSLPDENGIEWLNMNKYFRSRDAYDAAFMNCYAFIYVQEYVAKRVSEKIGREVKVGRLIDVSDSYHIYGRRLEDFKNRFLKQLYDRKFEGEGAESRTWTREFAQPIIEEAKAKIAAKIAEQDKKYQK